MHDEYWNAFTLEKSIAQKFTHPHRNPFNKKDKNIYIPPVRHYHYDKESKRYYLPPSQWLPSEWLVKIDFTLDKTLYDYQQEAVDFTVNAKTKATLIKAWVWSGKTIIWCGVINTLKTPTLIITPSQLICKSWLEKLQNMCDANIMTSAKIKKMLDKNEKLPDVLIVTRSSADNVYELINWYYDLLIIDEAHHISDTTKKIINMWKWWRILWLTATPKKKEMDEQDMINYFWSFLDLQKEALPVKVLTYQYNSRYSIQEFIKASEWLDPESPEVLRRLVNNDDYKITVLRNRIVPKLYKMWLRKFIVFVDRVDYAYKIKEYFNEAVVLSWQEDKTKVIDSVKDKDEFLIIAMSWCAGEWFDLPAIECGILFYSTNWDNSIEQLSWRARRRDWSKKYCYWVDVQHKALIVDKRNSFHKSDRLKYYKQRKRTVESLEDTIFID